MKNIFKQALHTLFSTRCLLCQLSCQQEKYFCDTCASLLPTYQSGCTHCGITLNNHRENDLCGKCLASPPPFDHVTALFEYAEPVSSFIHQLKFQSNLMIARWLAITWIDFLKNQPVLPDCIVPVPLHHTRLSERGFNQSLEIAKPIGHYFHIAIDAKSCIRIKNTRAQSSLSAAKRKNNVKNAFGLSRTISAKHVVILDDVMTTGNTVSEIAHLLRKVGVEKIEVWCCARV